MKLIFTLFSILISGLAFVQSYSRCKIITDEQGLNKLAEMGIAIDHGTYKKNTFFISDFSSQEIDLMRNAGFTVDVLISDVKTHYRTQLASEPKRNVSCKEKPGQNPAPIVPTNFHLGSMGGYFTYQEMLDELDSMASRYPNLISVRAPISTFLSNENRAIYWVRISDQASIDENESEVLYSAIHHAREPISLSSTIFYMWYLLENYASNPEIKFLLDETELYFVPVLNPDGYVYNENNDPFGGGMWRKNRRNNGDGTFGVDLNRNYSNGWGTTGISFSTSADTYPGKKAFSEPETQAMKWFCENRDFLFAFNAHSYGNLVLFPIGSKATDFALEHDFFQNLGNEMVKHNGFIAQKASKLYEASGDSDDYMYLDSLATKPKIYAYTPEIGGDLDGFWPTSDRIIPLSQDMFHSNLMLTRAAHNFWTTKDLDPEAISTVTGNFTHESLRLGLDETDLIVSIVPLSGIVQIGTPVTHNLNLNEVETGIISYELDPLIAYGDTIKYILVSDFGTSILRDTISKTYGNPALQFFEDAANLNNWVGNWALTSESFYSASNSFTDSPNLNYTNLANKTLTYAAPIDLTTMDEAKLSFYARWDLESNYDFARLEVSVDGGTNWIGQCGKYTVPGNNASGSVQPLDQPVYEGTQNNWVLEEINLSDYIGQIIQIRFILKSDAGQTADGFYFDDFKFYAHSTLGLDENKADQKIKLYPSPAQNNLLIAAERSLKGYELKIFDSNGRLIKQEKIHYNTNVYELNITELANGFYVTELSSPKMQSSKLKFLVAK